MESFLESFGVGKKMEIFEKSVVGKKWNLFLKVSGLAKKWNLFLKVPRLVEKGNILKVSGLAKKFKYLESLGMAKK
jgi:hypothetical protein